MEEWRAVKRFYKAVAVEAAGEGWRVTFDGKPIRTAGGRTQLVPSRALAEALAAEWADQPETLDPARFAMRDLADFAIDAVAPDRAASLAALLPYAETDTLCYRAEPDAPLFARQIAVWEPLLAEAEARFGGRFERVSGIVHHPQPAATLAAMRAALDGQGPFTLAALRVLASLSASLVIALAAVAPDADADALWAAACVEEEWQAGLWGREDEAEARRARRRADFLAARRFALLAGAG